MVRSLLYDVRLSTLTFPNPSNLFFNFIFEKGAVRICEIKMRAQLSSPIEWAFATAVAALLCVQIGDATYSCCSKERRGTVCTLAGSGAFGTVDSANPSTAAFSYPVGITLYTQRTIVVAAPFENRLRIIHLNGSVGTLAGGGPAGGSSGSHVDSDDPLAARFWEPYGVCAHNEGSLLVCDHSNNRIRIILRNGSVRTLAGSGAPGLDDGGYLDSADPLQAKFCHPHDITSIVENSQRLIFVAGHNDQRVRVIYANGTVSTLAGSGGIGEENCAFQDSTDPLAARFCHPCGVIVDRFGNVIVSEVWGNRIRKVWREGSQHGVTTLVGSGPIGRCVMGSSIDSDNPLVASFRGPIGMAIDGAGNILASCAGEHRVRIILVNGSVRTLAGGGPSIDFVWDNSNGGFVDNVPFLQARFNRNYFIAFDRKGDVIVTDTVNNRVRMLCMDAHVSPSPSASVSHTLSWSHSAVAPSRTVSVSHASARATTRSATTLRFSDTHSSSSEAHSLPHTHSSSEAHTSSPSSSPQLLSPSALSPISRLVSSEEAARAVVASGAAASALAGFAATTSMGHAARMGALMRSVECAFTAGDLDPPSVVELPLQWTIESQGGSLGSHAGSALLTSAVLVVLPLLMCAFVHAILSSCGVSERPMLRCLQCSVLSRYCFLSMTFFVPNVLMSSVVVVGRGASSNAVVAAICAAIVPLLLGCVAGQRALAMDVDVVPLCGGKWELRNRPSSSAFVETFGMLVDGCRDPMPYSVLVCFLEDAAASLVLSFLSGVSLSTTRCEWVALVMLVVSALHLLYVVCVRPLHSRVESAMNCSLCGVQVLMAALCLAIASGADNSSGVLMSVLGVVAVIQNVSFFVQAAILAACACVNERLKERAALSGDANAGSPMMVVPLHRTLLTAPATEATAADRRLLIGAEV